MKQQLQTVAGTLTPARARRVQQTVLHLLVPAQLSTILSARSGLRRGTNTNPRFLVALRSKLGCPRFQQSRSGPPYPNPNHLNWQKGVSCSWLAPVEVGSGLSEWTIDTVFVDRAHSHTSGTRSTLTSSRRKRSGWRCAVLRRRQHRRSTFARGGSTLQKTTCGRSRRRSTSWWRGSSRRCRRTGLRRMRDATWTSAASLCACSRATPATTQHGSRS